MSGEFEKYAIYWVPRRSDPLAQFGVAWTGWCAEMGELRPLGSFSKLSINSADVTRKLRRHGLHGVIRAPFRLAAGRSRFALERDLRTVIDGAVALALPRLKVAVIDGCVAIVPVKGTTPLATLIGRIDAAIDPIAQAEVPPNGRSGDQAAFDGLVQLPSTEAHRFHVPLTDKMDVNDAFRMATEMQPLLSAMLDQPRRLVDVALMADPGFGRRLRVLARFDLRLTPPQPSSHALPVIGPDVLFPTGTTDIAV